MTNRSATKSTLIAAGIGAAAVVTSPLASCVLLATGTAYAAWRLNAGRGIGRVLPSIVLVSIVLAAHHAPVKTIEVMKARRLALPKIAMSIAELRCPPEHGMRWPSPVGGGRPLIYRIVGLPGRLDGRMIAFPSREPTVAEFIQAIEDQAPLEHHFMSCGNGGSSILRGRNCAMGLGFYHFDPNGGADGRSDADEVAGAPR